MTRRPASRYVSRGRLHQAHDGVPGHGAGGSGGAAARGCLGGGEDDRACVLLLHARQDGAGEQEERGEVEARQPLPGGVGDIGGGRLVVHDHGVVDEAIDAAGFTRGGVHRPRSTFAISCPSSRTARAPRGRGRCGAARCAVRARSVDHGGNPSSSRAIGARAGHGPPRRRSVSPAVATHPEPGKATVNTSARAHGTPETGLYRGRPRARSTARRCPWPAAARPSPHGAARRGCAGWS